MDCEEEFVLALEGPTLAAAVASAPPAEAEEGAVALPPMETDPSACDVVVGSEEWHAGIDPVSKTKQLTASSVNLQLLSVFCV